MRRTKVGWMAAALALALAGGAPGCGGGEGPPAGSGEGVVEAVDPAAGQVTLDHGPIEGVMGAMTMSFEVADPALLAGVEAGERVRFHVEERAPGRYVVTALEPAAP